MALIDKASLLMVPSTYEAGKLYNVLPSGNRAPDNKGGAGYDQTRADFDFDRGSNAAATRINSSGLIEKYRENLFTESNNFSDSDWTKSGVSVTSGQSGYDETTNAYKIQVLTSGAPRKIAHNQTTANGVLTMSIYAKAGTAPIIAVEASGSNGFYKYFNLSTGTGGSQGGSIVDSSIVDVGSGWYRLSITGNPTTVTSPQFFVCDVDNSTTAATGSNILIQNAQLESGLVATEYLNSTSVTAKAGVLVDMPRINYDANGENGALLLEPSRQQLLPYSEDFSNSAWGKANVTLTSNNTISPDGTQNASKLVATGSDSSLQDSISVTSGTTYTLSVYLKTVSGTLDMAISLGSPGFPQNEGEGGRYKNITVTNEWKRYTLTSTADASASTGIGVGGFNSFTTGEEVYVWGAQLEAGSYATSYIPNHGESGGVTRAADIVSGKEDSSLYNDNEGVLFVEFSALSDTRDNEFRFLISDGTNSERLQIGLQTSGNLYASVITGNSASASFSYSLPNPTQTHKIALKYKVNDCVLFVDGVERGTDTSATMPSGLDVFDFYRTSVNNNYVEANVKKVIFFNEALSDSELATLTTL